MKQKLKKWFYTAIVLCMSLSCKKNDPCENYCCGAPAQKLQYIKTVENVRADTWSGGLVVEGYGGIEFCYQQRDLYGGKFKVTYVDGQPQPYKYRVWGEIYNCDNCPTLIAFSPVYYIKITKLETVNQ